MKRQLLLLLLTCFLGLFAFSQGIVINGIVKSNENNEPIPKVSVRVKKGAAGVLTDEQGKFRMARWQDSFEWEGELANGPLKSITTVDAQVSYKLPKLNSMLRLGGTNIFNKYYKNGYGNPEIGGVFYTSFIYRL